MTHGAHDPVLVAISVLIAIVASYTALDLARSVATARGRVRLAWLAGGSLALGVGVWAKHFMGILALRLPDLRAVFDIPALLLSLAVAITASAFVLHVLGRPRVRALDVVLAGMVLSFAIRAMHFIGILSMHLGAAVAWDALLALVSLALGTIAVVGALWLAFRVFWGGGNPGVLRRSAGAVVLGVAISGMHYTAMRAVSFAPHAGPVRVDPADVLATDELAVAVTLAALLVLGIAVASSIMQRALARQTAVAGKAQRRVSTEVALREEVERRRAEADRRERELRAVLEVLPVGVYIADAHGRVTVMNPATRAIWGAAEPLPSNIDEYGQFVAWRPGGGERMGGHDWALARALESGEVTIGEEIEIQTFDGERRTILDNARPIRDGAGRITGGVGVIIDITERKALEERQNFLSEASRILASSLEHEETLRAVARLAVPRFADWCAIFIVDEGRLRMVEVAHSDPSKVELARELERRYPPHPDERTGIHHVLRTGKPEIYPEISAHALDSFARDEEHRRMLHVLGLRSGMNVPLIARGRTLGVIGLYATESRRPFGRDDLAFVEAIARRAALAVDNARLYGEARRRAREEEALRAAVQGVTTAFTVAEVTRDIARSAIRAVEADAGFVEWLDIEHDEVEIVASTGPGSLPVGTRLAYRGSVAEAVIRKGEPQTILTGNAAVAPRAREIARHCPGCSALVVPLIDSGGVIGVLTLLRGRERPPFRSDEIARAHIFGNIAALAFRRVHLLEEAERRRDELVSVMESRSRLMRGFSHDVKNPLGAADGYLQLLEEGFVGPLSDAQKSSVAKARRSLLAALELIGSLLELARAEAGEIRIERSPVDVRPIARELAEEYRAAAEAEGLALDVHVPDQISTIHSDHSRIRQILGNLLSNATKYTQEGRITVRIEEREGDRTPGPGPWVAVDVADTGPGIPADKRHLLFREFKRIGDGAEPGVGLGLAISMRIARALNGTITVDTEVGRGSTFTLWLPVTDGGRA